MNKHSHRLVFSRSLGCCIAVAETVVSSGKSGSGERRASGARAVLGLGLAIAAALATHATQAQGLPAGAALTGVAPRPSLAAPASASVLPTGGTIVKGAGSISTSGATMTIDQTTQRLVADWQSFSIGAGNTVRFVQPSSNSVALNRVVGDNASAIFGALTANGHVYLQNANGVYFAPGAQISVGSLLATTLQVDPGQFMLGKVRLSGGSAASGSVVNEGSIVTTAGGTVVLAGPVVTNAGSITTPGGTTALVAGNAVNVDPTGSGLLSISVPVAAVNARLVQTGTITADGGAVQLAAAATDAALRTVMQVDGVVRARSIENHGGQIVLSGGSSGMVIVGGQLDASGVKGAGGTIDVLGDRVGLVGTAHLDASGTTGGGTVLVGGNRHGEGSEQNATNTYVGSGAVIDASATAKGNGGKVVVWADGTTTYAGQINARGGAGGGDGGQVEVSGKGTLNFDGGVDLRAPKGAKGDLLLDPTTLDIGTVANVDGTPGQDLIGNTLTANQYGTIGSRITATNVANLLATGNVTLAANQSIDVSAPLTVAAGGAASTLSLTAPLMRIDAGAPVTLGNASLVATAGSNLSVGSAITSSASVTLQSANTAINAPITAANVTLLSGSTFSANVINQDSGGAGTIRAGTLTIGPGAGFAAPFSANLNFSDNQIGRLAVTAGSANVRVANVPGTPLVVSGALTTGLTIAAVNTDVTQVAGAGGALRVLRGTLDVATTGSGNVVLDNAANDIANLRFNGAGNVTAATSGDLQAQGTATGNVLLNAGGTFTLQNQISGRNIDISGVGFINGGNGALIVPAGGRYFIRSSDSTQDDFSGPLSFGPGSAQINYIVYGGYTGVDPVAGNGFYTNVTGQLSTPITDGAPVSKVYDGTPNFLYSQSGTTGSYFLQGQQRGLIVTSYSVTSTGAFSDKNAGVDKGHTVAPTNNTVATNTTGELFYGLQWAGYTRAPGPIGAAAPGNAVSQITPKPITSTGVDGIDRVYNGTTGVGINVGGATLVGTIAGDTVGLSGTGATGTLADKNVGVNKPVVVTGLALTGADAGNYTVSDASAANATISQLGITSHGIVAIGRAYDGTTVVGVNGAGATLTGVLTSDTVGVVATGATGSIANKNVGTGKPVTVTGVALSGTDAGNYTVVDASGATVAITPKTITATGLDGVDRVYNGGTAVGINTAGAGLAGTIAGDAVGLVTTGATGTVGNKNVGVDKPVTVAGLSLGGADAGDYALGAATGATATITPKAITSTGFTGNNRVYDGTTVVGVNGSGATLVGVVGGDTVGVNAAGASGTVTDKNVGTGKAVTVGGVALAGADAGNYTVSDASAAVAAITPRPITSTGVEGVDRTYNGSTTVAVSAAGASLNNTIAGDNVAIVATSATGTMADKNAGTGKPVTVTGLGLGGTDAANYSLTDASAATVNIAQLVIAATGITATDRVYNGGTNVALNTTGAGVLGVLTGDTVGVDASRAVGSVGSPDPGAGKAVSVSGIALTGADAINYAVSATPVSAAGTPLTVRIITVNDGRFDDLRYKEYLEAVADAQEPFRRAMMEALLSGFGKENIRKQLQRGLVFETGLAPPAVDIIEPAKAPGSCTPAAGANLSCGH